MINILFIIQQGIVVLVITLVYDDQDIFNIFKVLQFEIIISIAMELSVLPQNKNLAMTGSEGLTTVKLQGCPIKVKPQLLEFSNIESNEKYEMQLAVRNQGKQNEKVRIIMTNAQYFTLKGQTNYFIIAPGLTTKIGILFQIKVNEEVSKDTYEDKILIIGNSFKREVVVRATRPNFKLEMPKIFKLGLLSKNKEAKFSIPIKNVGREDVQICLMRTSSPSVVIDDSKIVIKKQSQLELHIKITRTATGIVSEFIYFPNGDTIQLKGVCTDESVEICNKNGDIFQSHNFGLVLLGEKVACPFYLINNTSKKIEGLVKIFDKNLGEFTNLKIDLNKLVIINRSNPKKIMDDQKLINCRCEHTKISVGPFSDFESSLTIFKQPTAEDLRLFALQSFIKPNTKNRESSSWCSTVEVEEVMLIKIINIDQPIKVPVQFSPAIPKIYISNDKFQFPFTSPKQVSRIAFTVKNCNEKNIKIKLQNGKHFYFEGDTNFQPLQTKQFYICFRPLLNGEYSEYLTLSLFDVWTVTLKAYGECTGKHVSVGKQNLKINLKKASSLQNIKPSANYLSSQRSKRLHNQQLSFLKTKITERTTMGFFKNPDDPIDLDFDACQNPKVIAKKKFNIKNTSSGLFFDNEQYARTLAEKRKVLPPATSTRLNVKQIIKFSEELTAAELAKIQVKCDKLDFGSVFAGSITQKQFVVSNKNNKFILVEIDLTTHEAVFDSKFEARKIDPYGQAKFTIKLKPIHLGALRIPLTYVINRQHIFELDIVASVTLINLGFSTNQLDFNFSQNDCSLEKIESLTVTNYGNSATRYFIVEPSNKSFSLVSDREQEILPNSSAQIRMKYRPIEGSESGELRVDSDRIVVKIVGGAENIIKCEGSINEPRYSIKQTEFNLVEIFVSMVQQNKITIRNHCKCEAAINIQLSPPTLSQTIILDQRNFILSSEEKKEINFTVLSHDPKAVKGSFIVSSRGGKTVKIPININFCIPIVEVAGQNDVDLGTVHIMTNHFERQITLVNRMKTEIKLQSDKGDQQKSDYIIEFIAAHQKIELTYRDNCRDSEKSCETNNQWRKKSICIEDQQVMTAHQIKNTKNLAKIITLASGVETKFKMKFVPKVVKHYEIKIPLFMHKAVREIEPICQKIKCRAVQPLFYVNPYIIKFDNVVITDNELAYKSEFEIINPHDKEVDWEIDSKTEDVNVVYLFGQVKGKLSPKQSKKVNIYFHPTGEGHYNNKIKLYSNIDREIQVKLEVSGNAVSPRISFNKNLLILPVVPIKTESKGLLEIQNFGYEAVSISKCKFSHHFQGTDLQCQFLDGKLLSLAKKKLKIQISFKSQIPISFTTTLQIFDEFGDKICIPISATADNCLLTTYPYLEMNNSTVVFDNSENVLKLLVSKCFNSKNKQTNLSGSSAVTGNFIRKWCNYELNVRMENFPDGFVDSKGQLLYELIIKMTNGRPIVKKPNFTSEQKLTKMLELHQYYSEVIGALQVEGAFLNHIRPEYLLNLNDYLLYMMHKQYIIDEDEFQCVSHDAWTVLFYQLCKIYVERNVNEKMVQKFNPKYKVDRMLNSAIYSENEICILGFINQYLGQDKVYNLSDQAKLFEAIERILQRTFRISLAEDLSKLKINADSLMLHQFVILISKFLYSHLHQFGLSMYLEPNDLFTMGHKEFVLFLVSLMQNLLNFQTYTEIQFDLAYGEKSEKIIDLQNPSKTKKIKYWVKIYGSPNFKASQKQLQIEPQECKMLKITYHCKKNANEEAQLILVPVKDEDEFTNAHSLNFLVRNTLIAKTVMKKINMKAHLYDIKTTFLDVEVPCAPEGSVYDVKLIGSQYVDQQQYPNYYLVQPGERVIKNGRDKCEISIAALQLGEMSFKLILVSSSLQEYIYQFTITVTLPNVCHTFKLDSMTVDKEEHRPLKIPVQNDLKEQCMRFHREMNKQKDKKKKVELTTIKSLKFKSGNDKSARAKYSVEFVEESVFKLTQSTLVIGAKQKNQKCENLNRINISAEFTKPYREYRSVILVKNEQLDDYRLYALAASVSIRPKTFNLKMATKAREMLRVPINNKMSPYTFRLQRNIPQFQIEQLDTNDLVAVFSPSWVMKEELDLYIESPETFEQHTYKIKLESCFPEPVQTISLTTSTLFSTPLEIDLSSLKIPEKQLSSFKIHSFIPRKHHFQLRSQNDINKIVGSILPDEEEGQASLKLLIPKSQQFYEFIINMKNNVAIDLGSVSITGHIGQHKRHIITQFVANTKDFYYEYDETQNYLTHEITTCDSVEIKEKSTKTNFVILFKPTKEVASEKILKFRSNNKEYVLKVTLHAKKLETTAIPIIMTENLEKKSAVVIVNNHYDAQGFYETFLDDQTRFKVDNHVFEMKSKDKVQLKVNFLPKFIGDSGKAKLTLRSATLPELSYSLEGVSKFKCKQVTEEIQGYESIEAIKQLVFCNQFSQKQRFKFEIVGQSEPSEYKFDQQVNSFTKDIEAGQIIRFKIKNKSPVFKENDSKQTKIMVMRLNHRKIVKQYYLSLSVVKNLENKKYNWECRARQTIFETIKLPNLYPLKQIKTDPEIEKYITFNIDEKHENEARLKFSPLKPMKSKTFNILLISNQIKFRILCHVKVMPPPVDDTIMIRTAQVKQTGISAFRLTNVVREPAAYRTYFEKNYQQLQVEPQQGILEAYGKQGTPIIIKFRSEVHNKRVEDKLIVETDHMYWVFKVVGVQEKILNF